MNTRSQRRKVVAETPSYTITVVSRSLKIKREINSPIVTSSVVLDVNDVSERRKDVQNPITIKIEPIGRLIALSSIKYVGRAS